MSELSFPMPSSRDLERCAREGCNHLRQQHGDCACVWILDCKCTGFQEPGPIDIPSIMRAAGYGEGYLAGLQAAREVALSNARSLVGTGQGMAVDIAEEISALILAKR